MICRDVDRRGRGAIVGPRIPSSGVVVCGIDVKVVMTQYLKVTAGVKHIHF